MAENLDELIKWILGEIALSTNGISVAELLALIDDYYDGTRKRNSIQDSAAGASPKPSSPDGEESGSKDLAFKARVWDLLMAHEGVVVGHNQSGDHSGPQEARDLPTSVKPAWHTTESSFPINIPFNSVYENGDTTTAAILHPETQQSTVQCQARINLSENLKRRIVTRYSPESDKIQDLEWLCLITIARAREDGISKLDLMNATGIGKITIGRQTNLLVEKNLIEKRDILVEKKKISIFRLKTTVERSSSPDFKVDSVPISTVLPSNPLRVSARLQKVSIPESESTFDSDWIQTGPREPEGVAFTSYDECQRRDGVPGVYFDLTQNKSVRTGCKGRPRKRMIAIFKSERLKEFLWMYEDSDSGAMARALATTADVNSAIPNTSRLSVSSAGYSSPKGLKRKSSFDGSTLTEEPALKIRLLDEDRSVRESSFLSNRSNYMPLSSSTSNMAPCGATTTVSEPEPQSLIQNSSPYMEQYNSLFIPQSSAQSNQSYRSPYNPNQGLIPGELPKFPSQGQQISQSSKIHSNSSDAKIEEALKIAQKSNLPNVSYRLAVSWKGITGNLCLSLDQKALKFIPYEHQSNAAPLCIQVSEITEPPRTSKKGSRPMQLQISLGKKGKFSKAVHLFRFLPTDDEFEAANRLRAKVVTIMTIQEFRPGSSSSEGDSVPVQETSKPYQCAKCGKSWKNDIGLLYHQTKSRTSCNPQHDPTVPSKPRGRRKRTSPGPDSDSEVDQSRSSAKRTFDDITSTVFGEGDTSILFSKRHKLDDSGASNDNLGIKVAKDIVLGLLDGNVGVFPGDKGLWFGFLNIWVQKFPDTAHPIQEACDRALALLIDSGLAQKIQFSFRDSRGQMRIGTLVSKRGIDLRAPEVMETKEKIKAAFPAPYVPPEFSPSDTEVKALFDMEFRQDQQAVSNRSTTLVTTQILENDAKVLDAEFYSTMSGRITRRLQKNPQRIPIFDSDSDFETRYKRPKSTCKDDVYIEESARKPPKPGRKRGTNSRRGRISKRLDAGSKERGFNFSLYQRMLESEFDQDTDSERPDMIPQGFAVGRRVSQFPLTWAPGTTYLQNSASGAWDNLQYHQTTIHGRPQLPEPITFLQTLGNPAWNFRPSGHGARAKKAKGNISRGPALSSIYLLSQLSLQANEEMPKITRRRRSRRISTSARNALELSQLQKAGLARTKNSIMAGEINSLLNHRIPWTSALDELYSKVRSQASISGLRGDWTALNSTFAKNPGLDSLFTPQKLTSITSSKQSGYSFLRFLDPNTCLEDSATTGPLYYASPLEASRLMEQMFLSKNVDSVEPFVVSWVEPRIIKSQDKTWMKMYDCEFEEGSFTMQGWFPSIKDTLIQLLPHNLDDFLAVRQGRRGAAPKDHETRQWTTFLEGVDSVAQWEQGKGKELMTMGTIAPGYRFINHCIDNMHHPITEEPIKHQWLSENQFNLESLPYYKLCFDDEISCNVERGSKESTIRPLAQQKLIQNMFTTRRLVALPSDVEGILDIIRKYPDLSVEVAFDHPQAQPRKRSRDGKMCEKLENRLIVTVIAIRTLTGGLNKVIDWVLVSKLFPDFTLHFSRKRWLNLLQEHKDSIERMGVEFQRSFLEAYENGEVPPIDYDHLLDYDWNRLIDWAVERIGKNAMAKTVPELPDSRAALDKIYDAKETVVKKAWRDDYFSLFAPVYRRMENAASEPYTLPIAAANPEISGNVDGLTIAKSWVRAIVLTPEEDFDPQFTAQKISVLGHEMIKTAIDALLESKVICRRNRGRPVPGRGFDITDSVNISLRKALGEKQFSSAIKYKASLDAKFSSGKKVMIDWAADDGEMLAISNLQAHGRIRTVGKGIPNNRFGLTDGNYQTKQMDKRRLLFDIEIVPTPEYVYDNALGILETLSAPENAPPKSEALPLWYGISGKLIPIYWRKVVKSVLGTMALRPGIRIPELVRIFTPALVEWEIRILVDWLVRVGALHEIMKGREGWNTREWWWMIAGMV